MPHRPLTSSDAPPVLDRMQTLVDRWDACADQKSVFLRCYRMMTANMLVALDGQEFRDRAWVERLLHHFAGYYFDALAAYKQTPHEAPAAWQLAYDAACDPGLRPVQHLLLGVNAHINYDLVLTVADLLEPEWPHLTQDRRALRYADHCHVNRVIARTIDAVQDEVLDPTMPSLGLIDALLGPLDEWLVARLITDWREDVWQNAARVLEAGPDADAVLAEVEAEAVQIGERVRFGFAGWD